MDQAAISPSAGSRHLLYNFRTTRLVRLAFVGNLRAAYLHVLANALASLPAIFALMAVLVGLAILAVAMPLQSLAALVVVEPE
jgi:predicted small integral membrane protein